MVVRRAAAQGTGLIPLQQEFLDAVGFGRVVSIPYPAFVEGLIRW